MDKTTRDEARLNELIVALEGYINDEEENELFEKDVIFREALDIMKLHPDFALKGFGADEETPIIAFLLAGAGLDFIEELCDMNPDDVMYGSDAVHTACFCSNISEDIVVFLARRFPQALKDDSSVLGGLLPLAWALKERRPSDLSLDTIRVLVELYPLALHAEDRHGNLPLAMALLFDWGMDVLQYFVDTFPADRDNLIINFSGEDGGLLMFDLQRATEIAKLFPKLKSISFNLPCWSVDGFAYFMRQLQSDTSITRIHRLSLPYHELSVCEQSRLLVQDFCEKTRVQTLGLTRCLRGEEHDDGENAPLLSSLALGLKNNEGIQDFVITDLTLPNVGCISGFLLSDGAPKRVTMKDFKIIDSKANPDYHKPDGVQSKVEYVNLARFTMHLDCLYDLLYKLPALSSLKELEITAGIAPAPSIMAPLITILDNASNLESLRLFGFKHDCEVLCDTLRRNTTLHTCVLFTRFAPEAKLATRYFLDLIVKHNATLHDLGKDLKKNPSLRYYLDLNRCGRVHARDSQLPQFVQVLSDVPDDMRDTVTYGLLRESPSLWSKSACSDSC